MSAPRTFLAVMVAGLVAILCVMVWLASPAHALGPCGNAEDYEKALKNKFGETRTHLGLAPNGDVIIIFTNPEKKTFTIMRRYANGTGCLSASGDEWRDVEQPPPGTDL